MTVSHTKIVAVASGLLVGGFLFFRYYQLQGSTFWGLQWYEVALLLGGIGLAGVFPAAWLRATFSMAVAAFLGAGVQTYVDLSRDPTCCNLWPIGLAMWFFLGFPTPLIGGAICRRLSRKRIPQLVYLALLASGLVIGASLPYIQQTQQRHLETEEIPLLLKRIYKAEIAYSAGRSDKSFACDGSQLQEAGKLRWSHTTGKTINNLLIVDDYSVRLDCPNDASPHSFRATAFSRDRTGAPTFSIDETGELVVSQPARGSKMPIPRR